MPTIPYPNLMAAGVTVQDIPGTFDLWAGEANRVSDAGQAGAVALEEFRVIARDEAGRLVPWSPEAGAATGVLTFSGPGTAADTITINGHVITLVAAGAAGPQVNIGASAALTAQNLKAYINARPDETGVSASGSAAVLTLTAKVAGEPGNSITTVESGTSTSFGAATLVGGSEETEAKAIGFTAHAIPANAKGPIWTGGIVSHEALVWPATVTTLADRKRAFDGTNIGVRQLL